MIAKCEVCGSHVPTEVALEVTDRGKRHLFCSAGCADEQLHDVLPEVPALPRKILVPIDGSGPSVRAAEIATAIAAMTKGEVRLLAAVDPGLLSGLTTEAGARARIAALADDVAAALRQSAAAQLDRCRRFCERVGVPCTVVVEMRPPLEAILAAAADVHLVVMGSRGRNAISSASLGSHAQRVVTGTRTPVLVVH